MLTLLCLCYILGLTEYDHDDSKAKALEAETGIRVLRHSMFALYIFLLGFVALLTDEDCFQKFMIF